MPHQRKTRVANCVMTAPRRAEPVACERATNSGSICKIVGLLHLRKILPTWSFSMTPLVLFLSTHACKQGLWELRHGSAAPPP